MEIAPDAVTVALKFDKTSLYLTVEPASTSVMRLKERALDALRASGQPETPALGRPFADAAVEDMDVFVQRTVKDDQVEYVSVGDVTDDAAGKPRRTAPDGTAFLDVLSLADCDALYVGWRNKDADAPAAPAVTAFSAEE
ncbi:hypothetical protein MSPP1_004063 [Malassezia sp. CBS 17886]|nr:hypothetical protein MSPP1_004063 [Malassezia sp. CBS 17886]